MEQIPGDGEPHSWNEITKESAPQSSLDQHDNNCPRKSQESVSLGLIPMVVDTAQSSSSSNADSLAQEPHANDGAQANITYGDSMTKNSLDNDGRKPGKLSLSHVQQDFPESEDSKSLTLIPSVLDNQESCGSGKVSLIQGMDPVSTMRTETEMGESRAQQPSGEIPEDHLTMDLPNCTSDRLTVGEPAVSDNALGVQTLLKRKDLSENTLQNQGHLKVRGYQAEISRRSKEGQNDIIILPTGTGKTYVAIDIMNNHLRTVKEPKIVFMAPAVELVTQQYEKIREYIIEEYRDKVQKIVGRSDQSTENMEFNFDKPSFLITVSTPQIIENYMKMDAKNMKKFTLIIFDEFHHAKKEHSYNRLLENCMEVRSTSLNSVGYPQLVGLTATIGIGDSNKLEKAKDFILERCARMYLDAAPSRVADHQNVEELKKVYNNPLEIVQCMPRRKDKLSVYIQDELMVKFESELRDKIEDLVATANPTTLTRMKKLQTAMRTMCRDKTCQAYDAWCIKMIDLCKQALDSVELRTNIKFLRDGFDHLKEFGRALMIVQDLRCADGLRYLKENLQRPVNEVVELQYFQRVFQESMPALENLALPENDEPNPKLEKLKSILLDEYKKDPDFIMLIFVQQRDMTRYLCDWIDKELNRGMKRKCWRPHQFTSIGQSVESGGMARNESAGIMEDLKSGKINILVATSVAEEGIDIPACNVTIRYMYIKDVISKIQARGRTRAHGGKVYSIVDTSRTSQTHKNEFKEYLMDKALKAIREMPLQTFKEEMKAKQRIAKLEREHLEKRKAKPKKSRVPNEEDHDILCGKCGSKLGSIGDVRCYMKMYHLAWDPTLLERCKPGPTDVPEYYAGVQVCGKLHCSASKDCGDVVGKVVTIRNMKYGVWKVDAIRVTGTERGTYPKWKILKRECSIKDINEEELMSEGESMELDI